MTVCAACPAPITRSSTGLCKKCAARRRWANPEQRAVMSESMQRAAKRRCECPEELERMRSIMRNVRALVTPEIRAKAAASMIETKMHWCPVEHRALNRRLRREGYGIADRKVMIADLVRAEARRLIAANENGMIERERRRQRDAY
jgi:hypothetical protein